MSFNGTESRKYFHKERMPIIVYFFGNKTYRGSVSSYWKYGFSIISDIHVELKKDDIIPLIYLESSETDCSIENMSVLNFYQDEISGMTVMDVFASNEAVEEQFNEIFNLLVLKPDPDIAARLDDTRIPRFPGKEHYTEEAINTRLQWARGISRAALNNVDHSIFNSETLAGNIENYIGSVQIPLGLAGPIFVKGVYTNSYIPIPIATTEGALVSSICRGARVCNSSGGIESQVIEQQMLRAPVFFCRDMNGAVNLEKWIKNHMDEIKIKAESVSSIAKVKQIISLIFGDTLHLRFYYYTGDAAGQNMTSACTWIACEWISKQVKDDPSFKYVYYNIEGNMSGDKKVNYQNFINGRGVNVVSSCYIPEKILKDQLRVSVDNFIRGWEAAEVGSLQIGMMGSNINFANVIAGIFTATGQDIASVHESSVGIFKARKEGDGIQFTAHLPSLVIGTIGGGTKLPTQRDCLELMGCYGNRKSFRLAEIIAATCLALDISTGSAIAANEFVNAHEKLGRNRPTNKLLKSEINSKFFTSLLIDKDNIVLSSEEHDLENNSGIITNLGKENTSNLQGLFKYNLKVRTPDNLEEMSAVLKIKTADIDIINIGAGLARLSGDDSLPGLFETQAHIFGFEKSHLREIEFYKRSNNNILKYCPKIYGLKIDNRREIYSILMEDLSQCTHLTTINDPSQWDQMSIKSVLSDMAEMHSIYLNKFNEIPREININVLDEKLLSNASNFLIELTNYNYLRFKNIIPEACKNLYKDFIVNINENINEMKNFPMTLTHNDFNTRNLCLRRETDKPRLVLYDWELPCYQNPQHDLIEFLIFALGEDAKIDEYDYYSDFYKSKLEEKTGLVFSKDYFRKILFLNALEFATVRFNLYLLAHNIVKFEFMERVYKNLVNYLLGSMQQNKNDSIESVVVAVK